ncbi:hypothetical protein IWX75_002202 [Arthrobacter sp. CAN_A6]|uniref:hypothetical protein n=1 Tax=Arthrobacter sp. CAN_A6 TaxID=2787721 RepID=UPI0018C936C0
MRTLPGAGTPTRVNTPWKIRHGFPRILPECADDPGRPRHDGPAVIEYPARTGFLLMSSTLLIVLAVAVLKAFRGRTFDRATVVRRTMPSPQSFLMAGLVTIPPKQRKPRCSTA